jgi:hypothetical protein
MGMGRKFLCILTFTGRQECHEKPEKLSETRVNLIIKPEKLCGLTRDAKFSRGSIAFFAHLAESLTQIQSRWCIFLAKLPICLYLLNLVNRGRRLPKNPPTTCVGSDAIMKHGARLHAAAAAWVDDDRHIRSRYQT